MLLARFSLLKTRGRAAEAVSMPGPPREQHTHAAWGQSPAACHWEQALVCRLVPIAEVACSRTSSGWAVSLGLPARSSSCINLKLAFPLERWVHLD